MEVEVIRPKDLKALTGLSAMTVWRMEKKGMFPKRRKLSQQAVGWTRAEINQWLESRSAA